MELEPWIVHKLKTKEPMKNAFQLMISGVEFVPDRIRIKESFQADFKEITVEQLTSFYLGQELLDIGVQAAYYARIRFFSVHLQRLGKDISIISVTEDFTRSAARISDTKGAELLGSDLEIMIKNAETNKFASLPIRKDDGQRIGTDRTLVRKGHSFSHPIIELRTKPVKTGNDLYNECLQLQEKLEKKLPSNTLSVVSNGHPFGRFFLGGHLHISNKQPSYQLIQQLDQLLAIPLAAISDEKDVRRRESFGRLGSVRLNRFNGFEYRTLPSWYHYIREGRAFFEWIETVFFQNISIRDSLNKRVIKAYYDGGRSVLWKETVHQFLQLKRSSSPIVRQRADNFFAWLKQNKLD